MQKTCWFLLRTFQHVTGRPTSSLLRSALCEGVDPSWFRVLQGIVRALAHNDGDVRFLYGK